MSAPAPICITVLAHNEAARIATCLNSLPLGKGDVAIHVVVNGSTDATAAISRGIAATASNVTVHEFAEGGKARSWNRFVFDELAAFHEIHVFADGDAEIVAGSVDALAECLRSNPDANAAAGLPMNGRRMAEYQAAMRREHGLFGDLYALRGSFLARMKQEGIRLPQDLIGDDGLLCALAKTDLENEDNLDPGRVMTCEGAGFLCEPVDMFSPASWRLQYRRMINYSLRHFQNRIITAIMRGKGPKALPPQMAALYGQALPTFQPRPGLPLWWFDRQALRRMAAAAKR